MKKERAQDIISSYPFSLLCKTVQNVIPHSFFLIRLLVSHANFRYILLFLITTLSYAKEVKRHFFVSNTLDYFIVITIVEHLPPCLQYI